MTFDREYFESDNQNIGYRAEGYRDFAAHFSAVERIQSHNPSSVIEIGGARGYVSKKLTAVGIPSVVIDVSDHCFHTRAVEQFVKHDLENIPYPFEDKQFDLAYSDSTLEHIHYEKIDDVIKEIIRISKKGLNGIPVNDDGTITKDQFDEDNTHIIFESKSWWSDKFKKIDPAYQVDISGNIAGDAGYKFNVPALSIDGSDLVKLNIGSFVNMFYYGWSNTDSIDLSQFADYNKYIFKQHDATTPFPIPDGCVNLIFSSHMMEHLTFVESTNLMKECYRMMCNGGHIRIAVPDIGLLMKKYIDNDLDFLKHISPASEKSVCNIDKFGEVALANHAQIFDACSLKNLIESAGFKDVKQSDPFHSRSDMMEKETIVSHPTISLVMEATK